MSIPEQPKDHLPESTPAPRTRAVPGLEGKRADLMAVLVPEAGSRLVRPLDDKLYDRVFNGAFVPNSTEYADPMTGKNGPMLDETRRILRTLPKCERVLSVGTGTGFFDGNLLEEFVLEEHVSLEPNHLHTAQIPANTARAPWKRKSIVQLPFDERFTHPDVPENRYDASLWTHCGYFMKNVPAAVRHGLRYITSNGAIVMLHQTEQGVCEFFKHFSERLGLQWDFHALRQDHGMSTETISEDLSKEGIRHFIGARPAELYVDAFQGETVTGRRAALDMITFFLNTDVEQFPCELQDEMIAWVRERSFEQHGRKAMAHPQGFVVVPHPSSSLAIPAMREV